MIQQEATMRLGEKLTRLGFSIEEINVGAAEALQVAVPVDERLISVLAYANEELIGLAHKFPETRQLEEEDALRILEGNGTLTRFRVYQEKASGRLALMCNWSAELLEDEWLDWLVREFGACCELLHNELEDLFI